MSFFSEKKVLNPGNNCFTHGSQSQTTHTHELRHTQQIRTKLCFRHRVGYHSPTHAGHTKVWHGTRQRMKLTCLSVLSPRSSGTGLGCSGRAEDLLRVPIKLASRPLLPLLPSAPLILTRRLTLTTENRCNAEGMSEDIITIG